MIIWLSQEVREQLWHEADKFGELETGGVLLGWRHGQDWVVTGLIGPGPRAIHGRYAFVPDHTWQVQQLEAAFAESRGDLDYLGDWHTHPVGPARLSKADKRTLRRITKTVDLPVMLICDPSADKREMRAWSSRRSGWLAQEVIDLELRFFTPPDHWPTRAMIG